MMSWLSTLHHLVADNQPCVLVTVAGTRGSTPRDVGAKMIVTETETIGTIGGGTLEYQCTEEASQWLKKRSITGRSSLKRYPLGSNCGQCCGGVAEIMFEEITAEQHSWVEKLVELQSSEQSVLMLTARQSRRKVAKLLVTPDEYFGEINEFSTLENINTLAQRVLRSRVGPDQAMLTLTANIELPVLMEPLYCNDFHVAIFGAGHVGLACVNALSTLGASITLVDSRPGFVDAQFPECVNAVHAAQPANLIAELPAQTYILIMTHNHALDFELCAEALQREALPYCGLIGSITKRRRFDKRLRATGLGDAQLAGLTCPIGMTALEGKTPQEIAISVAAQLLLLRQSSVKMPDQARTQTMSVSS